MATKGICSIMVKASWVIVALESNRRETTPNFEIVEAVKRQKNGDINALSKWHDMQMREKV